MTAQNWQQIKQVFQAVIDLPLEDRAGGTEFDEACTRVLAAVRANPGCSGRLACKSAQIKRDTGLAALELLERHGAIVAVPIPTIEWLGGGSVRCMLAEVFLPRGASPGG